MEDKSEIAYLNSGFIRINKKPIYYVERYTDSDELIVYGVKEVSDIVDSEGNPTYDKDYMIKEVQSYKYYDTPLGKILNSVRKNNKRKIKTYKAPLFITEIKMGIDSFDGKYKLGFEERLPDKIIMNHQGVPVDATHQPETGVFLGLDRVIWNKTKVSMSEVMHAAEKQKESDAFWKI